MKRVVFVLAIVACAMTSVRATEEAVETEKSSKCPLFIKAHLDVLSAYVWRGIVVNDEPVWQPSIRAGLDFGEFGKFFGDIWANFNATKRTGKTSTVGLDQINYTIGYVNDVEGIQFGVGHIFYTFPYFYSGGDYGHSMNEIYATLAYDNPIVVPFIEGYWEYYQFNGFYALGGLKKKVQFFEDIPWFVGAQVSLGAASRPYMRYHFGGNDGKFGLCDANAELFTRYNITEYLYVGGRIVWTTLLDNSIDVHARKHLLWGGVNAGVMF
jgi:hypothetical protein